ncbi:MAG: gliding motility-associated C-terminal domain-containing protein [Bacteroidota bacterium]
MADFEISVAKICEDSLFTLTNNSVGAVNYNWLLRDRETEAIVDTILVTDNISPFNHSISQFSEYLISLQAISSAGCPNEISKEIDIIANPRIDIDTLQNAICNGIVYDFQNSTAIPNDTSGTFTWFLDDRLVSRDYQITPIEFNRTIGVNREANVRLEVVNDICTDEREWDIDIPGFFGCSFVAPNAFSPNNDGVNDDFQIVFNRADLDNIESVDLKIYAASDNLVYELEMKRDQLGEPMQCLEGCDFSFDPENWQLSVKWDGRFNGAFVENNRGNYYYILSVKCCNEEPQPRSGNFQLVR